jgi:hypothetical protein
MRMVKIGRVNLEELQRLCEWLDSIRYKSAYGGDICSKHPDLAYWISPEWLPQRHFLPEWLGLEAALMLAIAHRSSEEQS